MYRTILQDAIQASIHDLVSQGSLDQAALGFSVDVEPAKSQAHGDFATNFAMVSAKRLGMVPRDLASLLSANLASRSFDGVVIFDKVEIAGPGFINFTLTPAAWSLGLSRLVRGEAPSEQTSSERINVEFVSVNPNGPITIGSGRGAAYGSAICNVLQAAGATVHREYYVNDGVNSEQMRLFAESVRAICNNQPVPDNGYKGDYVRAVAEEIGTPESDDLEWFRAESQTRMIEAQRNGLTAFHVEFDTWFSEQSLHNSGQIDLDIRSLESHGVADRKPVRKKVKSGKNGVVESAEAEPQTVGDEESGSGETETLWLRSTKFGDDMDRVLQRRDGRYTYIASDVSYHKDKFNRPENADRLITVLGPDHHGYIARLRAVVAAMLISEDRVTWTKTGEPLSETDAILYDSPDDRDLCQAATKLADEKLRVQIFQIVRFVKDGKPAPMRKRDGNIYALMDLIREIGEQAAPNADREEQERIGSDVARFFYLMRHHDTAMDFDLDLATRQSDENPVYYVQYAHARICSVLERATNEGLAKSEGVNLALLDHPKEKMLMTVIGELPSEIKMIARDYSVNRLTTYCVDLARTFHTFYDSCRVVDPSNPELSAARVVLCQAARQTLKRAFELIGISSPERMIREAAVEASNLS